MSNDENQSMPLKLLIPAAARPDEAAAKPLPAILQSVSRGVGGSVDPLLACLEVTANYDLVSAARSDKAPEQCVEAADDRLLALEAADGSTIFIRADRLAEEVRRLCPDAVVDGAVDLARFRDPRSATRGLDDWLWRSVKVLSLRADDLIDAARQQALEYIEEKLGLSPEKTAYDLGSWLGAKALMHVIESRLPDEAGLYRWDAQGGPLRASDLMRKGDARLVAAAAQGPLLVFIHGTGSTTLGSFGHLPRAQEDWQALIARFPERVFAFEHRTFSRSPIENAADLAEVLPDGAEVMLVTHSRGGLVGDLLALGGLDEAQIAAYRTRPASGKEDKRADDLVAYANAERAVLAKLKGCLGRFTVMRYVRVASPARGTRLLSDNLDAALSLLLKGLQGAAMLAGPGWERAAAVTKRIVLEIIKRRLDPRLLPGIEAMLMDAPLGALLANATRDPRTEMMVIAGDTEFEGLLGARMHWRIVNLFADWALFDRTDNDLVVDTDSMFGGLGLQPGARYLFDQGDQVDHFSYFGNGSTRGALKTWLTADRPADLPSFDVLENRREITARERLRARRATRGAPPAPGTRPVVILIPGIMGSHIEVRKGDQKPGQGNRIWFDLVDLAAGALERIRDVKADNVFAEDLFEMFYGDLDDYLSDSHMVIRFPYDWRKENEVAAEALMKTVETALEQHKGQPVSLLAHSMGGLVSRMMIHKYRDIWDRIVKSGGRLVMLGTPNNGSHLMAHSLLGKSDSVRGLAVLSQGQDMQELLEIEAGFPGALQLLPRPDFKDTGAEGNGALDTRRYYDQEKWVELRRKNRDRWFGDGKCGVTDKSPLSLAKSFWKQLPEDVPNPERMVYVFGQADETPCGVREESGRLRLLFTSDGDGSVTWASGRIQSLVDANRCWYMPVEHADLAAKEEYFPAIRDLLSSGATTRLGRLPARRGAEAPVTTREAGPVPYPCEEELARSFLGSKPRRPARRIARSRLDVSVRAGDLRFTAWPVLCGHYYGDVISGAEAVLDGMVDGQLSQRLHMGVYADAVGTSAIALMPRNEEEVRRGTRRGAIVVGLGELNGRLSTRDVSETVRAGVLRLLLRARDNCVEGDRREIKIASLLIGQNSTSHISIGESLAAVVLGICEANAKFAAKDDPFVSAVEFIELYRDSATSAAHAIHDLPERLAPDLRRLNVMLEPARELEIGDGARHRLYAGGGAGYWPRLAVTDADRDEETCPPECYRARKISPVREEVLTELLEELGYSKRDGSSPAPPPRPSAAYPNKLRYVFVTERARTESVEHQRQPGLIESIVSQQIHQNSSNPVLSRTLFELMVPLEYKATARELDRLVLQVDGYTANLPWELMQAEDQPMMLKTAMVRQLATIRFRRNIRTASDTTACIIVDPSTEDYAEHFGRPAGEKLPGLDWAVREGEAIRAKLREAGYQEDAISYSPSGAAALDVLARLYERPYRILVISGHGVFEARHQDGQLRTGVVLSGGSLLTAAEVSQMEAVPEVVFLNCCHLGQVSTGAAFNKLAYSISRELIEMGVRCIVAAGWAVNDDAACTFAETFFHELLVRKTTFGEAVHEARKQTYRQHGSNNTWGAYQAYGDPGYRMDPNLGSDSSRPLRLVAVDELLGRLAGHLLQKKKPGFEKPNAKTLSRELAGLLNQAPPAWLERPEVLEALGKVYAEIASDGFEKARDYYLQAIAREDKQGLVAIRTIEQLANIEARMGERLGGAKGRTLVNRAISRLVALRNAVAGEDAPFNAERTALLGSAYKRLAAVRLRQGGSWKDVKDALKKSADAYIRNIGPDPAAMPYNTLNNLQFAWLAGEPDPARAEQNIALAQRCAETARGKFAKSQDFFDAVIPADAEMTAWLLGKPLDRPPDALRKCYDEAVQKLPQSARQWNSVITQWRLLAEFLRLRGAEGDEARAEDLEGLAEGYEPQPSVPKSAASTRSALLNPAAADAPVRKARRPRNKKQG